ncbi:MAG TPA: hypothetical protein VGM67_10040 [Gemmatimonadaceae bacterium]|jgi:hypothetical protein
MNVSQTPTTGSPRHRRRLRSLSIAVASVFACVLLAGCQHYKQPPPYIHPDPITIHVVSENFLDATVSIVAGGVTQRLGMVIGNSKATFTYPWNNGLATGVVMVATTIGGSGSGRSVSLSVNPGQVIDFKVMSILRQTYATVHDP